MAIYTVNCIVFVMTKGYGSLNEARRASNLPSRETCLPWHRNPPLDLLPDSFLPVFLYP